MSMLDVPQAVGRNLARARSLLIREDPLRALEALIAGLDAYEPAKLMGKVRFEIEVLVQECVNELNRQPRVRHFFASLGRGEDATLAYAPGREAKLKALLPILHKALVETESAAADRAAREREARKAGLREKGVEYLRSGEAPKGRAALRVLAEEFGGEPGVLADVGRVLLDFKLYFEAAEILDQAVEAFPKDGPAYAAAAECRLALNELEKAEAVYLKAVREFGKHPKTMLNLARLYVKWNKKDKAFEAAGDVLRKEPDNAEARAMVEKFA